MTATSSEIVTPPESKRHEPPIDAAATSAAGKDLRGAERRHFSRFDLMATVHVRHAAVDHLLELANFSRSGALILLGNLRSPIWMTVGRRLELGVLLPGRGYGVTLRGTIARIHGDQVGFGLHFDATDPETVRGVKRLIDFTCIAPATVPRP